MYSLHVVENESVLILTGAQQIRNEKASGAIRTGRLTK